MNAHAGHCDCAAYLRGVLHNLKRTGCERGPACAALPPGDRCDNCKLVERALHKTRAAAWVWTSGTMRQYWSVRKSQ